MARGTGSSASTKRMQNMITQVNNNGDGNGDVLNPHIPPVQNLSEPGEHSAEEMKLTEGSTVLPTLNVSTSPKLTSTLTKTSRPMKTTGVKHGVKTGQLKLPSGTKSPYYYNKEGHRMYKSQLTPLTKQVVEEGVKTGVKTGTLKKGALHEASHKMIKTGVKTGVKQGKKLAVAPLPRDKKSTPKPKHEAMHAPMQSVMNTSIDMMQDIATMSKSNIAYKTPDTKKNRRIIKKQEKINTKRNKNQDMSDKKWNRLQKRKMKLASKIER